ncbi:hypothetical protein [Thermosynechococcus vestitus]|uniref:Tll0071 protein n=1 Tax=Thermosynechococcus vestitus (strain NIES-2133 / IAM M-273 / BP-1) TaxID=197221 RepID=Q8DMP0_THEVB|nr:hypothetical protein [Thermosynechococcus vestitus]BAC07624.1 tll0071 [Thermosynechococcus vestitus BP-1]
MLRALHPGILTSLVLISTTAAITLVTAFIGYHLGRDSLRGVSQPVVNPILGSAVKTKDQTQGERSPILDEAQIIAQTKARIAEMTEGSSDRKIVPAPTTANEPPAAEPAVSRTLPIVAEDQGVRLEISRVDTLGQDLALQVSLKNDSSQGVQFIYTFLEITNDKGDLLSALTEGLPTELPAGSDLVKGTILIPKSLLNNTKTLTLRLASYPNQDVQLQAANIPVE